MRDPSVKPGSARARLAPTCGKSSPDQTASTKCRATSDGLKMKSGCSNHVASCHSTIAAISKLGAIIRSTRLGLISRGSAPASKQTDDAVELRFRIDEVDALGGDPQPLGS